MIESIPALNPERLLRLSPEIRLHNNCDVYSELTDLHNEAQQTMLEARESGWRNFHHH